MSKFAPGKLSIGICSRCGMKYPYRELREDGNIRGLYVCGDWGCYDEIDPYKLPPLPADNFTLHHPRPDLPLYNTASAILVNDQQLEVQDGDFVQS